MYTCKYIRGECFIDAFYASVCMRSDRGNPLGDKRGKMKWLSAHTCGFRRPFACPLRHTIHFYLCWTQNLCKLTNTGGLRWQSNNPNLQKELVRVGALLDMGYAFFVNQSFFTRFFYYF